jgi:RNA polymerase sigma-70 factor (ECF subfamily)
MNMFALTGDMTEAEDVVQEAFERAVSNSRKVLVADSPEAWLRTVARNVAINRRRRRVRLGELLRRHPADSPVVPEMSPDRLVVFQAIRRLPERQREAIALYYIADLSVDQIAMTTGVSVGTVKSRLHRGRELLTEILGPDRATFLASPSVMGDLR